MLQLEQAYHTWGAGRKVLVTRTFCCDWCSSDQSRSEVHHTACVKVRPGAGSHREPGAADEGKLESS